MRSIKFSFRILVILLFSGNVMVSAQNEEMGIWDQAAPDWKISQWIDGSGNETTVQLSDFKGKTVYILCFQHWCPGCHKYGFPTLQKVYDEFEDAEDVAFLVIQTVFEGQRTNTIGRLSSTQKTYDLPVPFGHDDGSDYDLNYSGFMKDYRTGGTPWVVIVGKDGKVVYNDFHIKANLAIKLINNDRNGQAAK